MFRGFLSLYQNNSLKNFFTNDMAKFKKIVNPLNPTESFDTIGIIDALFKVLTSELYEIAIYNSTHRSKVNRAWEEMTQDLENLQEEQDG
jgi:hypothetical protein